MADLAYRTQNVSIEDEDTGVQANVNASNELQTRDDDANTTLTSVETNTDNLDVLLSTRATEATVSDIETTANAIEVNTDNLDVLLSTRATETTLSGIKTTTDQITFDSNDILVYDERVRNAVSSPASAAYDERLYAFNYEFTLANNNETDVFLIDNPVSSGVNVRLWKLQLGVLSNVTVIWHLYYDPTVTANGTTATSVNTTNGSTNTPDINTYTLPTISARGNIVDSVVGRQGDTPIRMEYSFVIKEGQKGLLTFQSSAANNDFTTAFLWAEEDV